MHRRFLNKLLPCLLGAFIIAIGISLFSATTATTRFSYQLTDLGGVIGNSNYPGASDINDVGQVVSNELSSTGNTHAFLLKEQTKIDLGTLGGSYSNALSINNAGQVVGGSSIASNGRYAHAFLWQNNKIKDLGTLGGNSSWAYDINNAGQVVGSASTLSATHAFLWQGGKMRDLGTLDNGYYSEAYAINNAGQVVGRSFSSSTSGSSESHAFIWNRSRMTDLGTLGGNDSIASDINDLGQVVGASRLKINNFNTQHAFLWQNGKMTDLGTLGGDFSTANSINNRGTVVGTSSLSANSGKQYAFVKWKNSKMQNLNSLIPSQSGWILEQANAINNKGQIVGYGTKDGQFSTFLLTPTLSTQ